MGSGGSYRIGNIDFKLTQFESGFVGENLTLEKFESLEEKEKTEIKSILWEKNRDWLSQKFHQLNAAWLTVIDGEVITFSSDIDKYPQESDVLHICQKKGKFPFIFVNEWFSMIEESSSAWARTTNPLDPNDYYPTVEIQISPSRSTSGINLIADFDSGAVEVYLDMDRLISEGLITPPKKWEEVQIGIHLGERYAYFSRSLFIGIVSEERNIRRREFQVRCVRNWDTSPFILINRSRTALVGRRIFHNLKPTVMLNFANRRTEVHF